MTYSNLAELLRRCLRILEKPRVTEYERDFVRLLLTSAISSIDADELKP